MKSKIVLFLITFLLIFTSFKSFSQAVNVQDSLALVDFYNSTNGDSWMLNSDNYWKTDKPVAWWNGVTVTDGRVTGISLMGNHISGTIPPSFGNLTALVNLSLLDNKITGTLPNTFSNLTSLLYLHLGANYFTGNLPAIVGSLTQLKSLSFSPGYYTGTIPASFANLVNLQTLDVSYNQLSGFNPSDLEKLNQLSTLGLNNNNFTFKDLEPLVSTLKSQGREAILIYDQQANIHVSRKKDILFVSLGGTPSFNTLHWYKRDSGLSATTIDTFFVPHTPGNYYVTITNSIATDLTLYSDTVLSMLAENDMTVTKNIAGTDTVSIANGIFNIASLKSTGPPDGLGGSVATSVFIDPVVSVYNNQPYVQRHFDISPEVNADKAQAIVVLYFSQEDFDNYNSFVTTNHLNIPLLPANGVDNGNVRITQFHGSFTGSSAPGNYNGSTVIIKPSVYWDRYNQWWVVTFYVSGFSGFYLNTTNSVLPLTLMEFNGRRDRNKVELSWKTSSEINTKEFIVEGKRNETFSEIGTVTAQSSSGNHQYNFIDNNPLPGNNFYRLKMIDKNGGFTFSNVISIKMDDQEFKFYTYPNPANSSTTLFFNSTTTINYKIEITDASGKNMKRIKGASVKGLNKVNIDLQQFSKGIYIISLISNENGKHSLKLKKE